VQNVDPKLSVKVPAAQSAQLRYASAAAYLPATHIAQLDEPVFSEKVPAAQAAHKFDVEPKLGK